MKYWLMKSEPDVFSIEDLKKDKTTWWNGVRNYQARNFMMKDMKIGDQVLFYHSNAEPPGIAGLAKITKLAAPDLEQFDKNSDYFDPKASLEKPIWYCVQVGYTKKFVQLISLQELRADPFVQDMLVLQKGSRLSIQPVEKKHFDYLVQKAKV